METGYERRAQSAQAKSKHILNKSTAKAQYTFTRSQRFPQRSYKSVTDIRYYDVKANNHKPNITFGSSQRIDFAKKDGVPTSTHYNIMSTLTNKNNGIQFKGNRNECKAGSIFQSNLNPGPGQYNPKSDTQYKKINYSIGKKYKTSMNNQQQTPGPIYKIDSTLLDQKKFLSIYVRRNSTRIVKPSGTSFNQSKTKFSQNHSITDNLLNRENQNRCITSKGNKALGQSGKKAVICKESQYRSPKHQYEVPGPGYYSSFSEFIDEN